MLFDRRPQPRGCVKVALLWAGAVGEGRVTHEAAAAGPELSPPVLPRAETRCGITDPFTLRLPAFANVLGCMRIVFMPQSDAPIPSLLLLDGACEGKINVAFTQAGTGVI